MRLVRYRHDGKPWLGSLVRDYIVPLNAIANYFPTMLSLIEGGPVALEMAHELTAKGADAVAYDTASLLCPVERPGKFLAIGMNYQKHIAEAEELGVPPPVNQAWFNKQSSCVAAPYAAIDPGPSVALDYEVELAVVIGRPGRSIAKEQAANHVFGYTVTNDVSARDWQAHSPTVTVSKSFDTFGPLGPCIVTRDEIPDPHNLRLKSVVNGEVRQDGNTGDMLYSIWDQIAYLSAGMTLETGDVLATGTPSGVGIGQNPPVFLKSGDRVRCEIEKIGFIENVIK